MRKGLQKIRIFSNIFNRFALFFEYFRIFSNVFKRFRIFSNTTCAFDATPAVLFPHPDESGEPDVVSDNSGAVTGCLLPDVVSENLLIWLLFASNLGNKAT